MKGRYLSLMVLLLCLQPLIGLHAQFTSGNLVVYKVGDGTASLSNASTSTFLVEYTTAGSLVQTINVSNSGTDKLTNAGSGTSEGYLHRSVNGNYLVFAGYDAATGVSSIASSSSATYPRVVARVDNTGTINYSTKLNAISTNAIRSAATNDGTAFWAATSGSGVQYITLGTVGAGTQMSTAPTNTRVVNIFNSQLYVSSGSSNYLGVNSIGSGLPTTTGQTTTLVAGYTTGTHSAYEYAISPDAKVTYIADDGTTANGGGVQKWTYNGSTWSLAYTLNYATGIGFRGLTVDWSSYNTSTGNGAVIYATDNSTANNRLGKATDNGSASTSQFTSLATSGTNTVFRGVAFAPNSSAGLTLAQLTSGIATSPLAAAATDKAVLGFSLRNLSSASNFTALNVNFSADPTNDFTNVRLVSSTTSNYTGAFTTVATGSLVSGHYHFEGFTQAITSTLTYYFIVADINGSVSSSTPATTPSVATSDITVSSGTFVSNTVTGTAYSFTSAPQITVTSTMTSFSQTDDVASASQSYTVQGANMTDDIAITAPTGFQISHDNSSWSSTYTIAVDDAATPQTIYVRMYATPCGTVSGNITHSSADANSPTVAVTGFHTINYYSVSASNLETVTNWSPNSNGVGGTPPANFTADGQVFNIVSTSGTISDNWTVSGTSSKIVIGNGTSSTTFTIPDPYAVTGLIDFKANTTFIVNSNTAQPFTMGTGNASSTVEFNNNPTGGYTIPQPTTYGNLTLKNGTKTFNGNTTTIAGDLVFDGITYNGSGASPFSTINLAGNLTYNNAVTPPADANSITLVMNGTGIQTITGNSNVARFFRLQTLNASSQIILASAALVDQTKLTLGNPSGGGLSLIAGSTLTLNNNTLEYFNGKPTFSGTGTITGSANSNLIINNNATTGSVGSFYFTSGSETLNELTINLSSASSYVTLGSPLTVNGTLTLTKGAIVMGASGSLTLPATATLSGGSANSFIAFPTTATGQFKRGITGTGSLTFPVGDNTSTFEYSPVTINFSSGTFSSGEVGIKLANAKHTSNTSNVDYLKRNWTISSTGITSFSANVVATYTTDDVVGTEGNLFAGKWDGSAWTNHGPADVVNHYLNISGLTSFGDFTAGESVAMNNSGLINITMIPEGYYTDGTANLSRNDVADVYLLSTTSPYSVIDHATMNIDKTTYVGQAVFSSAPAGTYYIMVKGKSFLETWSKSGGSSFVKGVQYYNFTTAATQAYGSNMIQKGTKWCIYSGDVNQDGKIDYTDMRTVDVDVQAHASGDLVNDVNGDGIVDFTDVKIVDNNSHNNVQTQKPAVTKAAAPQSAPTANPNETDSK